MNHETKKECCKSGSCNCSISNVIGGAFLLVLLGLTIWNTCQISKIYQGTISQYGNEANFKEVLKITQSSGFASQAAEGIAQMKAQFGIADTAQNTETTTEETTATSTVTDVVNTDLAPGAAKWAANAQEAETYFEMSGTPANVVLNTKTGNYKAIGGAYPQAQFEAAVATIKAGAATTDQAGKAGTLTPEQLASLLKNVHYYKNEGAEIVIIEYSDLLCPFCQRHFAARTLENIADADPSVAVVFKNMPLAMHPTADLGAKGVECAGQIAGSKAFYDYIAKAFTYSMFTKDNVVEIATSLGLDKGAFEACINQ